MAPFRPTNINKRSYPGNANVVGPTVAASLGITTTTCCSSTGVCGACACFPLNLGCCKSYCACPCCNVCCCCNCTTCTQTVPGGMWNASEQYTANVAGAWGSSSTSSSDTPVCLCCTGVGCTCVSNLSDCEGYYICAPNYFFKDLGVVKACNSEACVSAWESASVTNGWFFPTCTQFMNTVVPCRTYAYLNGFYCYTTSYKSGCCYWSIKPNYANVLSGFKGGNEYASPSALRTP